MERLRKLGPKHKAAARLRVEGLSNADIAKTLHVKVDTLYEWFSDDLVKEEIGRQLENIDNVFALRMSDLAMTGIAELINLAQMPVDVQAITPHQKLEALREALDRMPQTAKVGADTPAGGGVNNFILPPDMPVDQLIARGRQLLLKGEVVDGTTNSTSD